MLASRQLPLCNTLGLPLLKQLAPDHSSLVRLLSGITLCVACARYFKPGTLLFPKHIKGVLCSVLVHIQMLDSSTGLKRGLLFLWGANSSSEPPAICLVARAAV